MNDKRFFDTNVFLYLYSDADKTKRQQAKDLYREHALTGSIVISTQVAQEVYAAATRKMAIPNRTARELVEAMLELPLVVVNPLHIKSAIDNEQRYKISFWDGLIIAAAQSAGAGVLYTENLNHGQQYGGVLVQNPFN